ncbi:MAG: SAM-dependent chlorinase/fluorinase [Anaerolineales bacterium]
MSTITLLTDFGLKDGNVGVMKGVIWGITPDVHIADLSHHISPQNVHEAALVLRRAAPYFPDGTVHVVVVDPGVGTERRPIAAQLGNHYFIGPDNGVVTMLLEHIEAEGFPISFIHLNKPQHWLPEVSSVFHGRDIFAPAAAHLAAGVTLTELGDPIDDPIRLSAARTGAHRKRLSRPGHPPGSFRQHLHKHPPGAPSRRDGPKRAPVRCGYRRDGGNLRRATERRTGRPVRQHRQSDRIGGQRQCRPPPGRPGGRSC